MRLRARPILNLAVLAVVLLGTQAVANARPRHERLKAVAWKEGGKVVGVKFTMMLRASEGRSVVKFGLGDLSKKTLNWDDRAKIAKKTYLIHRWPVIKGLAMNKPTPLELKVRFDENKKLKPGMEVEVVSMWNNASENMYWHFWGLQAMQKDTKLVVKLPNAPAAAKKPAAKKPAAKKPAAKKPAAKKPVAKKPAAKKPVAKKPVAKKPVAKKPAAKKPPARVQANLRAASSGSTRARATRATATRSSARARSTSSGSSTRSRARTARAR